MLKGIPLNEWPSVILAGFCCSPGAGEACCAWVPSCTPGQGLSQLRGELLDLGGCIMGGKQKAFGLPVSLPAGGGVFVQSIGSKGIPGSGRMGSRLGPRGGVELPLISGESWKGWGNPVNRRQLPSNRRRWSRLLCFPELARGKEALRRKFVANHLGLYPLQSCCFQFGLCGASSVRSS